MGKAKLIGMNNAYIPNSKADARFRRNVYQRNRDKSERFELAAQIRRERREHQKMAEMKGAKA